MMFKRGESAKPVWTDWHEFRENARKTAYSEDEFGEVDKVKYDLDTADITGRDNPRTYELHPAIDVLGVSGTDIRTLDDR